MQVDSCHSSSNGILVAEVRAGRKRTRADPGVTKKEAEKPKQNTLVPLVSVAFFLIDLDGTLVSSCSSSRVESAHPPQEPSEPLQQLMTPVHDKKKCSNTGLDILCLPDGSCVAVRPGARAFLDVLLRVAPLRVAVWTASERGRALAILHALLPADRLEGVPVWSRECCQIVDAKTDTTAPISKTEASGITREWAVRKRLAHLFSTSDARSLGAAASCVLHVDDDLLACADHARNVLPVPSFDSSAPRAAQDKTLLRLATALLSAWVERGSDVRDLSPLAWRSWTTQTYKLAESTKSNCY